MKHLKRTFIALVLCFSLLTVSCGIFGKSDENDAVVVDYYCSVGAYLNTLTAEVDEWNATVGKEKGVFINIISDIANYWPNLSAFQKAGKYFALYDCGMSRLTSQYEQGFLKNLYEIDNEELKAIIEGYEPYIQDGINKTGDKLVALPLELLTVKLAVNTDLFEKNNLSYPKTWEDVLNCAKVITENPTDDAKGFGWSTWNNSFCRFVLEPAIGETGKGWWDPNTESYSFSQYQPIIETVAEMYQKDYMMGADDLDIDQMRAQFAEGNIGMFVAYSYDYAVLTDQFPAKCNWTLVDYPTVSSEESPYKGIYIDRVGCSINKAVWDASDEREQNAIVAAFCFLNSDGLNQTICEAAGMIPYKSSIFENIHYNEDVQPQWALFCDVENRAPLMRFPVNLLTPEGENYEKTLSEAMHGYTDIAQAISEIEERYNSAYQKTKDEGNFDLSTYRYSYDNRK